MIRLSLGILAISWVLSAQPKRSDYQRDVHPVLAARCFSCHGGDKRFGGLSLKDYTSILEGGRSGAAVVPGDAKESLLMRRVTGEVAPSMPPGVKLPAGELAALRAWIDEGARRTPQSAAAKRRWQPTLALTAPTLPPAAWPGWDKPVDRIVSSYLKSRGVTRPLPVNDRTYARRVYLDVWGLLPSPEQLAEFTSDPSPDKRSRLIRQLMSHRRNYAEHWISFWNDLLHNEDLMYHGGDRKTITPWLLKALEENQPYSEFLAKLLNPVEPQDPHGYLLGVNWRGDVNASQTPAMQAAQNTAQVFLGINLKCNSCHDSFISRWKLKDAYGLAAYFSEEADLELVRCDNKTGETTGPHFLYKELEKPAGATLAERHQAAAAIFTDPANGRTPRTYVNRIWHRLMGRGIVEPLDDMDAEPWSPALLDWLAADFVAQGQDPAKLLQTILESNTYQLAAVPRPSEATRKYAFRGPYVRRLTAEQFLDSLSAMTGEWRTYFPPKAKTGLYVRDYRMKPSAISTALGRPNREQVVTERNEEATTLQALELVNGRDLFQLLTKGARRLMLDVPPAPVPLWESGPVNSSVAKAPPSFEVDVSKAEDVWLLVTDLGSYDPVLTKPLWLDATLITETGEEKIEIPASGATLSYRLDLRGKAARRLRATTTLDPSSLRSDISPSVRFFVFGDKPDMDRLLPVAPETPVAQPEGPLAGEKLITRVYRHAYGRAPRPAELQIALKAARDPEGLADVLWSIALSPEFQLIR